MSRQRNLIVMKGNLIHDPEIRELEGGSKVASFRIANNRDYVKNGEKVKKPLYIDVSVWDHTAEFVMKNVKKGSEVEVEGNLEWREWEKDGVKKQSYKINARELDLTWDRGERDGGGKKQEEADDLPW